MKKKIVKGYLSSRNLYNNSHASQKIQNLVIRNTCERYGYSYRLGSVEYIMKDSFLILNSLIDDKLDHFDGIGFYSLFQLPVETKLRASFISRLLKKNKFIIFCNEKLQINNLNQIDEIDTNYKINLMLRETPTEDFFKIF